MDSALSSQADTRGLSEDKNAIPLDTDGDKMLVILDDDYDNNGWSESTEAMADTNRLDDNSTPADDHNNGTADFIEQKEGKVEAAVDNCPFWNLVNILIYLIFIPPGTDKWEPYT